MVFWSTETNSHAKSHALVLHGHCREVVVVDRGCTKYSGPNFANESFWLKLTVNWFPQGDSKGY